MAENTHNKVAIITGASSGIGQTTAIALSAAGWRVALFGRREVLLQDTARQCKNETLVVVGDVADEGDVARLFAETINKFGRLDMLFNNAGTGAPALPLEELPLSLFQKVLNTNLIGTFLCTREAVKIFKSQTPQGGRIINNGSISAHTPRPHSAPYTATKHAVSGMTKSTALDGRAFNISCTQIDIGNAHTPMAARLAAGALQPDGSTRPEAMMDQQHVADAVVHIASLPNEVQVLQFMIMATGMPFVGRG
ncbi:short-chain dehydrogenase [Gloeophyllum trabeum ATCC 11539]|uniref:Short-chain dehydrogenase n=1 Tax=Gloeophyllum trabeum (strain ATCC 11539 / FP-39264 / Madison 617) TaxID=670483 RepID=S7RPB3_GLOTA|nr:short-chain dehydrogenase [Gloeophyllum trabeum ATCC 11539]EPQ54664.1 short-chain dehydrogenase [Gloeophyllum trabeum ATCC 11539]